MTDKASDRQVGGDHYKSMAIQPGHFCQVNELNHYESSIVKYVCRHKQKGQVMDLEKVIHYAQLLIEEEYEEHPTDMYMRVPSAGDQLEEYLNKTTPKDEDEEDQTEVTDHPDVKTSWSVDPSVTHRYPPSPQLELPLVQHKPVDPTQPDPWPVLWYEDPQYPISLHGRYKLGNGNQS